MATPRKRYFYVADSILWAPWTNDEVAAHTRLLAYLNVRRSRENLDPEKACRATLGPAEIMQVTGKRRLDVALTLLRRLPDVHATSAEREPDVGDLSVELRGNVAVITWRNVAKFQEWSSRNPAVRGPEGGRKTPSPDSVSDLRSPDSVHRKEEETPSASSGALAPGDAEPFTLSPPEPAPEPRRPRPKPSASAEAVDLAHHLADRILRGPVAYSRVPSDLSPWALEIDRMLRLDKIPAADIRRVIDWSTEHHFWRRNIRSAGKLRQQFGRLFDELTERPRTAVVHSNAEAGLRALEILNGGRR